MQLTGTFEQGCYDLKLTRIATSNWLETSALDGTWSGISLPLDTQPRSVQTFWAPGLLHSAPLRRPPNQYNVTTVKEAGKLKSDGLKRQSYVLMYC